MADKLKTAAQPSETEVALANFKSQEKKALAKLERIKTWPKEHRDAATLRTQNKLNQIREDMKPLVKTTG